MADDVRNNISTHITDNGDNSSECLKKRLTHPSVEELGIYKTKLTDL